MSLTYFLVRLKSGDYKKEQTALSVQDAWVDIPLDKSRINHYKGTGIGKRMEELDEKEKTRKHKMAVNQTISIGILKNDLIYILPEKDPEKQDQLFRQIYEGISKNLAPVRPGRHYRRTKGQFAGKYSNTHKRAY